MNLATGAALRVLIVEDHSLLIDGLRDLLGRQSRYEVVGAISSGLHVYEACQRLSPDIVLLDLGLPGMDGIDVIRQLRKRWSELRIVVVTAAAEEWRGQEARDAGAIGYVLKQSPQQVLLAALQHAALGKPYVDPALRLDSLEKSSSPLSKEVQLTLRERQVLKLVAEGNSNRNVAELLSISLKTVETHRLNLMRKRDAHKATELNNWARRLGLL